MPSAKRVIGLKALLQDSLVVWLLDCLGRSLPDLVHFVGVMEAREIGLDNITEMIKTTCLAGEKAYQMFAALAELERNLVRARGLA